MENKSPLNQQYICSILNVVSRYAILEDATRTLASLEAATEIIRYVLDSRKRIVTLKEEIDIIRKHLVFMAKEIIEDLVVEDSTGDEVVYINHLSVYIPVIERFSDWNKCNGNRTRLRFNLKGELLEINAFEGDKLVDAIEIYIKSIIV
jgi:Histidine kinase.